MRAEWNDNGATARNSAAISSHRAADHTWRGKIMPDGEWFPVMAFELWYQKVAANLQVFFLQSGPEMEVSDRTLRAWASGANEPPATRLALLLRSSDGRRVLAFIMRDCQQEWWAKFQRAERIYKTLEAELKS